jgi:glucan phosphoethanolaminetransferase (alkaline phosphatase superfamily)
VNATALALPALAIVMIDVVRRGARLIALDRLHCVGYAACAAGSLLAWGALLFAAAHRRSAAGRVAAAVFVVGFTLAGAVQTEFYRRYGVYAALDAQIDAESVGWAVIASLEPSLPMVVAALGWLALSAALLASSRRLAPTGPAWRPLLCTLGPIAFFAAVPASYRTVQSSTPDVLYFHGLREAVWQNASESLGGVPRPARVMRRRSPSLPVVTPAPAAPRNVLLVVQEAVRADAACVDPRVPCSGATPATAAAAPDRLPLLGMRATSSSTQIALAAMWSGLEPTARREDLARAPLVWEYAKSAGYATAYLTSQHLMFANAWLFVQGQPFDRFVMATHLDPLADILVGASDEALSERALAELRDLPEPFFAVVHYSNVHRPRLVDPERAPFQPTDTGYRFADDARQDAYYLNSVFLSDLAVARLLEGLRARPEGARTVVFYLSDHAESRFEHGQANDHGATLYDEEIHVPAWIDAPGGTLSEMERASLREARDAWVFQSDVCPTLLDLLGLADEPTLAAYRARMPGRSLLRPLAGDPVVVMSNVSWAWEYGDPNWGLMQGSRKLFATQADEAWRCFDVAADPAERNDIADCADLRRLADETFGMLPRDLGRLRKRPGWGSTR